MSTSSIQFAANRSNSQRSTGPVTPEGKAVVAQNAVKQGLLATRPVLAHEDPEVYQRLLAELVVDLGPVGALEHALVERIALAIWRQQRLTRAECAQLQLQLDDRPVARHVSYAIKGTSNYRVFWRDDASQTLPRPFSDQTLND